MGLLCCISIVLILAGDTSDVAWWNATFFSYYLPYMWFSCAGEIPRPAHSARLGPEGQDTPNVRVVQKD